MIHINLNMKAKDLELGKVYFIDSEGTIGTLVEKTEEDVYFKVEEGHFFAEDDRGFVGFLSADTWDYEEI